MLSANEKKEKHASNDKCISRQSVVYPNYPTFSYSNQSFHSFWREELEISFNEASDHIFTFVAFAVAHFRHNFAAFSNEFDPSL